MLELWDKTLVLETIKNYFSKIFFKKNIEKQTLNFPTNKRNINLIVISSIIQ